MDDYYDLESWESSPLYTITGNNEVVEYYETSRCCEAPIIEVDESGYCNACKELVK